jgi:hypothetical protein
MHDIWRSASLDRRLETPKKSLKPGASRITPWRPEITRAPTSLVAVPAVTVGEPALRPDAVRAHLEATRALLRGLTEAATATDLSVRAQETTRQPSATERERVRGTIEAYRLEVRLDDVLRGALRQVTALMEERGLR